MLDLLYGHTVGVRRRWYERFPEARRRLDAPVISVGNLSVGGTGKTPLVAMIAEWLLTRGEKPAILSRGYARIDPVDGVEVVSDGSRIRSTLARAGDEPLMLAEAVRGAVVCVCEDRHLAGVVAERKLGATVHILDDGFQHVQLARDVDILVTSVGEIPSGRVLPFGRLREARAAAARAHFVVVVGADHDAARREAWELGISGFAAARRRLADTAPAHGADAATGRLDVSPSDGPRDRPPDGRNAVVAVAGIGRPEQFFAMLEAAGYELVARMSFRDHHRYTATDVSEIANTVRTSGARSVVTTAKDAARFRAFEPLPFPLHVVPLVLEIDPWTELTAALEAALRRVREAA